MRAPALGSLVILLAACGREAPEPAADPPEVHAAAAETGTLVEWLRLPGRVVAPPDHDATLSFRVDGVIAEVKAQVGERVAHGETLARIDTATLQDAIASANAAEASAAADAEAKRHVADRTRELVARGVLAGEQAETDEAAAVTAESLRAQASAAKATATRRGAWARLTAPFDGVVVRILRHAGESVDGTAATPVLEIAAEHPVQIALEAPAATLARVKVGQTASIAPDATKPETIPARVSQVAAAVDAATGTGPVRIDPTAEDSALVLGRIVEARIGVTLRSGAVFVPAGAIRPGEGNDVEVVVISDHKAHVRTVTTGIRDGERVEIVSGLTAGERIVVEDAGALADGTAVRDAP